MVASSPPFKNRGLDRERRDRLREAVNPSRSRERSGFAYLHLDPAAMRKPVTGWSSA
jgi:hypothetical protein